MMMITMKYSLVTNSIYKERGKGGGVAFIITDSIMFQEL